MEPMEQAELQSRIRVVFSLLKVIGPVTVARDVGPKLLVAHSQRAENGVVIKGKFWHYYPCQNFKAEPTFRLELSLEIHPEATPYAAAEACEFLRSKQMWVPIFKVEETTAVMALLHGDLATYLEV